jgi:hypothetical protein
MGLEFILWFEFTRFVAEEGLLRKLIRQEGAARDTEKTIGCD